MNNKKFIFFVAIILLLSGCTRITNNLDDVIDATMINKKMPVNTVSTGYEIYIPTGVGQVFDSQYNQKAGGFRRDRYLQRRRRRDHCLMCLRDLMQPLTRMIRRSSIPIQWLPTG